MLVETLIRDASLSKSCRGCETGASRVVLKGVARHRHCTPVFVYGTVLALRIMSELIEGKDFYWEGAYMVFTAEFHLRKGECCGSGCRHCPYEPRWTKGTHAPSPDIINPVQTQTSQAPP